MTIAAQHRDGAPAVAGVKHGSPDEGFYSYRTKASQIDSQGIASMIRGDDNAWRHENYYSKGLAKWHGLQSDGFKAGVGEYRESVQVGDFDSPATYSTLEGAIDFMLLCNDRNELPEDCECDKRVDMAYSYSTDLFTRATIPSGGLGSKWSGSTAQDLAAFFCYTDSEKSVSLDDVEFFGAIDLTTSSSCDQILNPAFGEGVTALLLSVGSAISIDTSGVSIDLDDLLALLPQLAAVLQTNYYQNTVCDQNRVGQSIRRQGIIAPLEPNRQFHYRGVNAHQLHVMGRRNWHSMSSIVSNYYMSAVVLPGATDEDNIECCVPYGAAHLTGDVDSESNHVALRQENGSNILLTGQFDNSWPNGLADSPVGVWGDEGYLYGTPEAAGCDLPIVGRSAQSSQSISDFLGTLSVVYVYDVSGRLIVSETQEIDRSLERNLTDLIFDAGQGSGIYIYQVVNGSSMFSNKIFVR